MPPLAYGAVFVFSFFRLKGPPRFEPLQHPGGVGGGGRRCGQDPQVGGLWHGLRRERWPHHRTGGKVQVLGP